MGQIHQHLVLFNHVALNDEMHFLEHIPHLQKHFIFPAQVTDGFYKTASGTRRIDRHAACSRGQIKCHILSGWAFFLS
jgi:hypothetical protein